MSKIIKSMIVACLAFFSPALPLFFAVGAVIFADTVTGVWKVRKTDIKFSSTELRKGFVSKMVFYQGAVLTMYLLDIWVIGEFMAIFNSINLVATKLVCVGLVSVELISINENFEAVTGKSILHGVKSFLNGYNNIKKDL
jgi:hypothetical protein